MHALSLSALLSVFILIAISSAVAQCQGANSLDIPVPSAFTISNTTAFGDNSTTFGIQGGINLTNYGGSLYVAIPTNAPDGVTLMYFQDNSTRILFRNNTLALPIGADNVQPASLVLATGDVVSSGGQFYGQVDGIELDTVALSYGNVSDDAVIYLNSLPQGASYRISLSDDQHAKDAIMSEALQDGESGTIEYPMIEIAGTTNDSQNSIGYVILRTNSGSRPVSGNVTAYRYYDGGPLMLPCKTINSVDGTYYEAISPGPGVFAFVGNFPESPMAAPGINSILTFSGAIAAILLTLVTVTLAAFKKMGKNRN